MKKTKKLPIWVYFYNYGARGFGHIGLIIRRNNNQVVRYSQGPINPLSSLVKLLFSTQKVRLSKKIFPPFTSPTFIAKEAKIIELKTSYTEYLEQIIDNYIINDRKYHSLTNNCAGFISITLNEVDDLNIPHHYLPKRLFNSLLKHNKGRLLVTNFSD